MSRRASAFSASTWESSFERARSRGRPSGARIITGAPMADNARIRIGSTRSQRRTSLVIGPTLARRREDNQETFTRRQTLAETHLHPPQAPTGDVPAPLEYVPTTGETRSLLGSFRQHSSALVGPSGLRTESVG